MLFPKYILRLGTIYKIRHVQGVSVRVSATKRYPGMGCLGDLYVTRGWGVLAIYTLPGVGCLGDLYVTRGWGVLAINTLPGGGVSWRSIRYKGVGCLGDQYVPYYHTDGIDCYASLCFGVNFN